MRTSPTRASARRSSSGTATRTSRTTKPATRTGEEAGVPDPARAATLAMDMQRAMAVLSDAERAAIVQCYHNDLSHEEAAQVLNCPVGTVKTHILRAKQKLKTRLAAWARD